MRLNSMRLAALASLVLAGTATAQVSTFDTDAEGWGTFSDARDFTWTGALGNPAGAIRATDERSGDMWFFAAPALFLGNQSGAYGTALDWDILGIQGNHSSFTTRADVVLVGGGLQLGINVGVRPDNNGWTSWSALIDESANWKTVGSLVDGTLNSTDATEGDLRTVLGSLDGLYIRGEYTNGADSSALDNVSFVPAPGATALLGFGVLGAARRKR